MSNVLRPMRTAPVSACELFMYSESMSSSKSPYSEANVPSASSKCPSRDSVRPAMSVMPGETAGRRRSHRGLCRAGPARTQNGPGGFLHRGRSVQACSAGAGTPAAEHVEPLGEHLFEVLHGT